MSPESKETRQDLGRINRIKITKEIVSGIIHDVGGDPLNFVQTTMDSLLSANPDLYSSIWKNRERSSYPPYFLAGASVAVTYHKAEDKVLKRPIVEISSETLNSLNYEPRSDDEVLDDINTNHRAIRSMLKFFLRDSKRGKNYPIGEFFRGFVFVHRAWEAQREADELERIFSR